MYKMDVLRICFFVLMMSLVPFTKPEGQYRNGSIVFSDDKSRQSKDLVEFDKVSLNTALYSYLYSNCRADSSCFYLNCQHGKVYNVSTGCCACTCRRGYIMARNERSCVKAIFGAWSSWSECIKSDWGGVQHRERLCKTRLGRPANNRCIGAGSQSRSCSEVLRPLRIRKNIRSLSNEDLHDLIQGFTKFKNDNSLFGFMNLVKWHGWPYRCPWYSHGIKGHKKGHCSWHHHPMFLAWHRLMVVQLEMGISRHMKNKTLGIPYWDWLDSTYKDIPELVKNPTILDPILKKYVTNPFFRTYIPSHAPVHNKTLYNYRAVEPKGYRKQILLTKNIIEALIMPTFEKFDKTEVKSHDQIHGCMCVATKESKVTKEDCLYSMVYTDFAAFDPMFFLHHSQVDRVLALYRHTRELLGQQDWTKEGFLQGYKDDATYNFTKRPDISGSFDWPMSPFCNASMNPSYVTLNKGSWTIRNSHYYQELFGYKYDSFDLGGKSWLPLLEDIKKSYTSLNYGHETPFVSAVAPELGVIYKTARHFIVGCTTKYNPTKFIV